MTKAARQFAALTLAATLPLAACGSTAAQQGGSASGSLTGNSAGNGLGGPAQTGTGGVGSDSTISGGTTGPAVTGGATGTSGGSANGTGTAGGTSGPVTGDGNAPETQQALAPGITKDKVYLGIAYFPDAAASNAAIGASGANGGDQRDYSNAVIDDLNKRGGILGRKVVPIYFEIQSTSSEPVDSQLQKACDRWTKDNKVFAITFRGRVLQECARKAGILITDGSGEASSTYSRLPNMLDPGNLALDRLGGTTVSGLATQAYFKPAPEWAAGKVGVITWDNPNYRAGISQGYLPALKKLGLTAPVKYVQIPQTVGNISDSSAAVSSAVLAFRSAGIDHVLIQDGPAGVFGLGGLTLLFLQNANSQQYYPRYGFNANNVPGFSIYPARQQHGMLAVDYGDYMPSQDEGISPNPARTRCLRIMKEHGVTANDQTTYATAGAACDSIWFVETLLKRAPQLTLQGAITAAEGLGTTFVSTLVYGTRFGPGRHDGADRARNAKFDDACSCMKYTSKPYAP
jgi:hypothetical protein